MSRSAVETVASVWDTFRRRRPSQGTRAAREVNVGRAERLASGVAGGVLLSVSLRRRRLRTLLVPVGVGLLRRAVTGHCEINAALGRNSAAADPGATPGGLQRGEGVRIEQAVTIARPRDELFQFWRQFDNLPRFMDNLEAVTVLDPRRSHWVVKGPLGTRVEWDAEIDYEVPDELISWRSLPGSQVEQIGSVQFTPAHGGGTEVRTVLRYRTPAGLVGDAVAHLLGDDPARQVADDLRRFKQVMEAGEVSIPLPGRPS
jgi:uncharacterized membrane protein